MRHRRISLIAVLIFGQCAYGALITKCKTAMQHPPPIDEESPHFLTVGKDSETRRVAYLEQGRSNLDEKELPGVLWLSGFGSVMTSTKPSALARRYTKHRRLVRFDYSGHGQSPGNLVDGTITRWLDEANDVLSQVTAGPQILVGSSMGGYLALLLLRKALMEGSNLSFSHKVHGLVLLAPAWDMTHELLWKSMSSDARRQLEHEGVYRRPSAYSEEGYYPITRSLIKDGQQHLLSNNERRICLGKQHHGQDVPQIEILHGCLDLDVPLEHSEQLVSMLPYYGATTVRLHKIPDGDHRLSRPQDWTFSCKPLHAYRRSHSRRKETVACRHR